MWKDMWVTTQDIDYIFARNGAVNNMYYLTQNRDIKKKCVTLNNHVVVYPIADMIDVVGDIDFFKNNHEFSTHKAKTADGREIECVTFLPNMGVYSKLWIAIVSGCTGENVGYKMSVHGIEALQLSYSGMKQKYTAYTCNDTDKIYDMGDIQNSRYTTEDTNRVRKTVIYCHGVDEEDAERQYNERSKLCSVNGWSYDEVVKDVGNINGWMDLMVRVSNGEIEKIYTNQEAILFNDNNDLRNLESYYSSDFDAADRTMVETLKQYVGYMAGYVEELDDLFNDKSQITVTKGKKKNANMHKEKVHGK